jgi:hypothetical protein
MRRWWVIALMAGVGAGCAGPGRDATEVPFVEEFRPPPNEDRFNNPPEQGYRKPPPKKEFKPGMGAGNPGMGGMGGPGF